MNKTGLSIESYVDYIKLQLGSSVVSLEIEEDLPKVVEAAFNEMKHYITDVETMTLPYANKIDLSGKKVSSVVYVMRSNNLSTQGAIQNLMYVYPSVSPFRSPYNYTSNFASAFLSTQNKNTISTDLDFHYDKREEQLYVHAIRALPTDLTIVYVPDYESVDEIFEPYWQNLLKRLSLAMTKEILGRVRGKYKLNSSTYSLDSDQLLSEAQQELTELRTYLSSNSDVIMPLD